MMSGVTRRNDGLSAADRQAREQERLSQDPRSLASIQMQKVLMNTKAVVHLSGQEQIELHRILEVVASFGLSDSDVIPLIKEHGINTSELEAAVSAAIDEQQTRNASTEWEPVNKKREFRSSQQTRTHRRTRGTRGTPFRSDRYGGPTNRQTRPDTKQSSRSSTLQSSASIHQVRRGQQSSPDDRQYRESSDSGREKQSALNTQNDLTEEYNGGVHKDLSPMNEKHAADQNKGCLSDSDKTTANTTPYFETSVSKESVAPGRPTWAARLAQQTKTTAAATPMAEPTHPEPLPEAKTAESTTVNYQPGADQSSASEAARNRSVSLPDNERKATQDRARPCESTANPESPMNTEQNLDSAEAANAERPAADAQYQHYNKYPPPVTFAGAESIKASSVMRDQFESPELQDSRNLPMPQSPSVPQVSPSVNGVTLPHQMDSISSMSYNFGSLRWEGDRAARCETFAEVENRESDDVQPQQGHAAAPYTSGAAGQFGSHQQPFPAEYIEHYNVHRVGENKQMPFENAAFQGNRNAVGNPVVERSVYGDSRHQFTAEAAQVANDSRTAYGRNQFADPRAQSGRLAAINSYAALHGHRHVAAHYTDRGPRFPENNSQMGAFSSRAGAFLEGHSMLAETQVPPGMSSAYHQMPGARNHAAASYNPRDPIYPPQRETAYSARDTLSAKASSTINEPAGTHAQTHDQTRHGSNLFMFHGYPSYNAKSDPRTNADLTPMTPYENAVVPNAQMLPPSSVVPAMRQNDAFASIAPTHYRQERPNQFWHQQRDEELLQAHPSARVMMHVQDPEANIAGVNGVSRPANNQPNNAFARSYGPFAPPGLPAYGYDGRY